METKHVGQRGSLGTTILRVALGLTTLFTWFDNVDTDFYDGTNFAEFSDWVAKPVEDGGNGASLGFVHSVVDNTLLQAPLTASAIAVFLNWGGRVLGVDGFIVKNKGESPATLIW